MHTIFHWLQNEVWYRGLRHILLMLWLFSSGKTQKIGCIYRIWVLKFIRASWQEWRFLSNRSSDHDVSHIKQNYPISSRCYKRPHVDIFICVAKKLNWNRGILNERTVYLKDVFSRYFPNFLENPQWFTETRFFSLHER